jgi:hypothetical protein
MSRRLAKFQQALFHGKTWNQSALDLRTRLSEPRLSHFMIKLPGRGKLSDNILFANRLQQRFVCSSVLS